VLDQLPDRFEARFKTKDMRTAVETNARRKVPYPIIGPITINLKWMGPVDRLFDWLVTEEKIEKNPADGIRSNQEVTEAANTKRLPFKPDQISKLFAITSAASPRTALYWLPLLMLTTDLCRWTKQTAMRGNARNIDGDGVCGYQRLYFTGELARSAH
jgi:hypothetical protein